MPRMLTSTTTIPVQNINNVNINIISINMVGWRGAKSQCENVESKAIKIFSEHKKHSLNRLALLSPDQFDVFTLNGRVIR